MELYQSSIEGSSQLLSGAWHDLIFQADFLLVIGGGRTGSYGVAHGERD